jgi:hypothetical protein
MELSPFTRLRLPLSSLAAVLALAGPASAQIKTEQVRPLDLWSAAGRDTGLGADLWRESSADLARAVLTALPDKPLSPAAAALARRVLATGANAPDGAGDDLALAGLRARALLALGDPEAAAAVVARTPRAEASEPLSRARAEAALLLGRDAEACETGQQLQEGRDGQWWLKLRAYCHLVAGETPAAQVTLDLWRQQGGKDAGFETLAVTAIQGAGAPKAVLSDPIAYALSRRLKLDPTPALAGAPAAMAVAVARDAEAAPLARSAAAARALRLGALSPEAVRAAYTPPGATETGADLPALARDMTPEAEAALATEAALTGDIGRRQEAVVLLLRSAKSPADFQAVARLVQPRIAELVAAKAVPQDAALLAAAAAAAGDGASAEALRAQVVQPEGDPAAASNLALLDAAIAAASGKPAAPAMDRIVERGGVGDAKTKARTQAAALLLAATGQPLSPAARSQFATFDVPIGKTTPGRLAALDLAAARKLPGETALYALSIALQQPSGLAVADRAAVVRALQEAGLSREARALALEGLVALARP